MARIKLWAEILCHALVVWALNNNLQNGPNETPLNNLTTALLVNYLHIS